MKKPNFILLFIGAFLTATSASLAATDSDNPTTRADFNPLVSPATGSSSSPLYGNVTAGAVPLAVTPASYFNNPSRLNLARFYNGAAIVVIQPDGEPKTLAFTERDQSPYSVLLGADSSTPAPIGPGPTRVIVDLGRSQLIDSLGFYSFSANGSVDVYYSSERAALSPDSTRWKLTNARATMAPSSPVDIKLQPLDARYVMLAFYPTGPGSIGALAIYAQKPVTGKASAPVQPGVNGVPATTTPNQRAVDFDFGPSAFGSRVTHISGGNVADAQNFLDGNPKSATVLGQDNSAGDNIIVIDLGATREVNKLGLVFHPQGPGNLEFYMLDTLPPSMKTSAPGATALKAATIILRDGSSAPLLLASTTGSLAEALALSQLAQSQNNIETAYLPPDFFASHKPIFVKGVKPGDDRFNEKFDKLPCRYLIIRWVPDSNAPGQSALALNNLSLIGPVPEEAYSAAMATYAFAEATSTTGGTGGTGGSGGGPAAPPGGGLGPGPPPPVSP
jgi:hypothetical protein